MFKILADECINFDIVLALRKSNFNVLTVKEAGLSGKSDEDVFDFAQKSKIILLTFDRGFGDIFRFNIKNSFGIIILLIHNMTKTEIINIPVAFFKSLKNRSLKSKLVIIGKNKIRVIER